MLEVWINKATVRVLINDILSYVQKMQESLSENKLTGSGEFSSHTVTASSLSISRFITDKNATDIE